MGTTARTSTATGWTSSSPIFRRAEHAYQNSGDGISKT
jgi:hypothetical protein